MSDRISFEQLFPVRLFKTFFLSGIALGAMTSYEAELTSIRIADWLHGRLAPS